MRAVVAVQGVLKDAVMQVKMKKKRKRGRGRKRGKGLSLILATVTAGYQVRDRWLIPEAFQRIGRGKSQ